MKLQDRMLVKVGYGTGIYVYLDGGDRSVLVATFLNRNGVRMAYVHELKKRSTYRTVAFTKILRERHALAVADWEAGRTVEEKG